MMMKRSPANRLAESPHPASRYAHIVARNLRYGGQMARWPSQTDGKAEKIRGAALTEFAARGVDATSLREVAARAGVSIGLIQHHFGNKGGLVEQVNRYVADVLRDVLASGPGPVTVDDFGKQVMALLTEHTAVADYLARSLIEDDNPFWASIFDTLIDTGVGRWKRRSEAGQTAENLDLPWAAMNTVTLFIGTVLLRSHIERQLPEPLRSPAQLDRWSTAVNALLGRAL
ncbi:hypothetical protein E3G68_005163 [Mycobacteroides abscessus]|nr:hypothetical protein [Mycobacteroides abscessus]